MIAVVMSALAGSGLQPTGDGALHVNLSEQIGSSFSLNTGVVSHYPPLYHLTGAIAHAVAGPIGVQAISFLAFGLTSWFSYLFAREVTGSRKAALAAQLLVTFSPVMLWYSSITLMEPLLTAAIMASLYLALRAINDPCRRNALYLAAALSSVALIKQTGLPIVGASLLFVAVSGLGLKRSLAVGLLVTVASVGPYMYLYSRTGAFTDPGNVPIATLSDQQSSLTGSLLTGGVIDRAEPWSLELDIESDSVGIYEAGTVLHENRKVYWRNIATWSQFQWIHTLYPTSFSGYESVSVPQVHWLLNLSLIAGLASAFWASRHNAGARLVLLALGASYIAMSWGTDTKRLFLYVPVISAVLVVLPFSEYSHRLPTLQAWLRKRVSPAIRLDQLNGIGMPVVSATVVVLAVAAIVPLLMAQFEVLDRYDSSQGGGFGAVGGVASIEETAGWLNGQLGENEAFVAASVYEWEYYSGREDLWDEGLNYRTYFLPADSLDYYLNTAGANYVVIRENQVIDDSDWNHIELIPRSFLENVEALYPLAYTSTRGDIKVFEVTKRELADA